jgi:hypothetical protein
MLVLRNSPIAASPTHPHKRALLLEPEDSVPKKFLAGLNSGGRWTLPRNRKGDKADRPCGFLATLSAEKCWSW